MKRILFSVIAICGLVGANAQHTAVSTATNTLAGPVHQTVHVTLNLHNMIRIIGHNLTISRTFDQVTEFDAPQSVQSSSNANPSFVVSSNRPFHVSLSATEIVKTNDYLAPGYPAPVMPMTLASGVIDWKVTNAGSGVFPSSTSYQNLSASNPNILHGNYGPSRTFDLAFQADPGWNYEGGVYKTDVTVTATQE